MGMHKYDACPPKWIALGNRGAIFTGALLAETARLARTLCESRGALRYTRHVRHCGKSSKGHPTRRLDSAGL